jgi:hypothetical protein
LDSTRGTWQRVECFSRASRRNAFLEPILGFGVKAEKGVSPVKYIPMEFIEIAVLTLTVASCYLFVSPL